MNCDATSLSVNLSEAANENKPTYTSRGWRGLLATPLVISVKLLSVKRGLDNTDISDHPLVLLSM